MEAALYQEHVARVWQGVGCPDRLDFGRWMRDEGGRCLRDARGFGLERPGWVKLSRDQLQLLTAKLGACSNVRTIDLSGERCSAASCDAECIRCAISDFSDYDCFQDAGLEAKAALRWLGRCKGTLHCRASISLVREGYVVV